MTISLRYTISYSLLIVPWLSTHHKSAGGSAGHSGQMEAGEPALPGLYQVVFVGNTTSISRL